MRERNTHSNSVISTAPRNSNANSYLNATGAIPYNMTNDYMFRAVLQKSPNVLKGLICSLLHLSPEDIRSIEITNPIVLGEAIQNKTFVLDVKVRLNNSTLINLEMQVINEHNWPDRSLSYLCRAFNQLQRGQDYDEILPVIHIGFLDFPLFSDHSEFYGTYKLLNIQDHYLYSDKLTLSVVELNRTELATEEDKAYQIDYWARLFKATTWEELKMMAEQNDAMKEATQTMYELSSDWLVQDQCYAREDYNRRMRTIERDLKIKQQLELRVAEQEATMADMSAALADKDAVLADKDAALADKDAALADKDAALANKDAALADKDAEIARLKALLNTN